MLEYLIVGLIVLAAFVYVLRMYLSRYLPKSLRVRLFGKGAAKDSGCGSGCDSCGTGCESDAIRPAQQPREQVIKFHK